jgi:hypothetical protein
VLLAAMCAAVGKEQSRAENLQLFAQEEASPTSACASAHLIPIVAMYADGSMRIVTLVSAMLSLPTWADLPLTEDQLKLHGIDGYQVAVEDLAPDAAQCGVTVQQLKTQTEQALRKNGIPVINTAPDTLYVRLSILSDVQIRGCYYSLEIQVHGAVLRVLGHIVNVPITATLWQKSFIAGASYQNASRQIRELLAQLLDLLCKDHLAANPSFAQSTARSQKNSK